MAATTMPAAAALLFHISNVFFLKKINIYDFIYHNSQNPSAMIVFNMQSISWLILYYLLGNHRNHKKEKVDTLLAYFFIYKLISIDWLIKRTQTFYIA